jgi:hypothetical protein
VTTGSSVYGNDIDYPFVAMFTSGLALTQTQQARVVLTLNIKWPKLETNLHLEPMFRISGASLFLQDMTLSHRDVFALTLT